MTYKYIKTIITTGLLLLSVNVYGQQAEISDPQLKYAVQNYAQALSSESPGVVESALYNSVILYKRFPHAPTEPLLAAAKTLYETSQNARVRHKAYLLSAVILVPHLDIYLGYGELDEAEFYEMLSMLVSRELISKTD